MILIKQLLEAKMSPARFKKALDMPGVLLGYEIEMLVPEGTPMFGFSHSHEDYDEEDSDAWEMKRELAYQETADNVADALMDVIHDRIFVRDEPHGIVNTWKIEPDSSIREIDQMGVGLELCTPAPPKPMKEALADLRMIFDFMEENDIDTNESTGFHINISFKGMIENLDWVKLVMFLGENKILSDFNREGNRFALPQSDNIVKLLSRKLEIDQIAQLVKSSKDMQQWARRFLSLDKYSTINFSKATSGYLEFRAAGGDNYHRDYELIEDTVGRIVRALQMACDPDAESAEYQKKLYKLFDSVVPKKSEDQVNRESPVDFFSKFMVDESAIRELMSLKPGEVLTYGQLTTLDDLFQSARIKKYMERYNARFNTLQKRFLSHCHELLAKMPEVPGDTPKEKSLAAWMKPDTMLKIQELTRFK
jgi:hypothetical protein